MEKRSLLSLPKSQLKILFCTTFLVFSLCTIIPAQEKKISGTVVSAGDNLPMTGVNVVIKGTVNGTTTDSGGNFIISSTGDNPVLVFSFIGFNTHEVSVVDQSVLNIKMVAAALQLDEIVVTSLGIKREKKALTYSAQAVAPGDLSISRDLNVINSLSGHVAGIDIIRSNSGVGSPTRVLLRGNRSIYGNNQPLYVVDGAPISNNANTPYSDWGGVAMGDGIGNINPEDIESVTVLKGPSATAIYGSRANNGAIVITTKNGKAGKGIGVEYSLNYSAETPIILTRFQNIYGQGNEGLYFKDGGSGWGPVMDGGLVEHWTLDTKSEKYGSVYPFVAHPDNYRDFFRTGTNLSNSVSFNAGNQDIQSYFSYTNTLSSGIVQGNDLKRNNINLRITASMLKRLSLDAKITSFHQNVNNRVTSGEDISNPVRSLIVQPGNISLDESMDFEYTDTNGDLRQNYWNPGGFTQNQYWVINRIPSEEFRNRTLSVVSAKYEIIDGLSLQVRSSLDFIDDKSSQKLYNDTYMIAPRGNYKTGQSNTSELNNDLLLNFNRNVTSLFSINISLGGNMLTQKNYQMNTDNTELLAPNLFTVANALKLKAKEYGYTKKVNSFYGFATLGLKNWLFLDLTARNDWSSTLPPESWSYFYPSAGLTWIVSDILKSRPGWLTFAKVRASLAQVGNDTEPYQLDPAFIFRTGGELGYLSRNYTMPPSALKPEITTSSELGFDIRFLHNRIGLDLTLYKSNSKNQLLWVQVPAASGYYDKFINAGNIQNTGIEATLNLKPIEGEFSWDMFINFAKNNSLVVELAEGLKDFTLTGGQLTLIKVVEGSEYGDIYTRGFVRNNEGRKLIDDYGQPITTSGQTLFMGNYNPDWTGGIKNSFAWKGFDLSFLVDIRMGGEVFSTTQAYVAADGYADYTVEGRDGMVVDGVIQTLDSQGNVINERENDIEITAETYYRSMGGRDAQIGEIFKYDASNIRVREALLGYTEHFKSQAVQTVNISLVCRNLFFIMNKSKILDPNLMVGNNNSQGNESFGLPGTRTIGMNLRVTF